MVSAGRINEIASKLWEQLSNCNLCPHNCGVNRLEGQKGFCRVLDQPVVSSYGPHFGEEPELVGYRGSGTIFFTACNLACKFCQNHDISQNDEGDEMMVSDLVSVMIDLQKRGCHNINLVTPTHQVPMIVRALAIAKRKGLLLPVVYNSGGYESVKTLKLLEGVIDIYMPDYKWSDNELGRRYSGIPDYADQAEEALIEMHRQVGELMIDDSGIAAKGLLVRHLVMPGMIQNSKRALSFIATELSTDTYVNIMDQYHPAHKAYDIEGIDRPTLFEEHAEVLEYATGLGLRRGF